MIQYRRNYIPGGIYFFTVTLKNRKSKLLTKYVESLKIAMQKVKEMHPYKTLAFVILPDHLHTIWQLRQMILLIQNDGKKSKHFLHNLFLRQKNLLRKIAVMNTTFGNRDFGNIRFKMKKIWKIM